MSNNFVARFFDALKFLSCFFGAAALLGGVVALAACVTPWTLVVTLPLFVVAVALILAVLG